MVRLHVSVNPVFGYLIWIHLLSHEIILYVQYVYPQFVGLIFDILVNNSKEEKFFLTVHPAEGAVVKKTNIFLFRMKKLRVQTQVKVNSLNSFKVSYN